MKKTKKLIFLFIFTICLSSGTIYGVSQEFSSVTTSFNSTVFGSARTYNYIDVGTNDKMNTYQSDCKTVSTSKSTYNIELYKSGWFTNTNYGMVYNMPAKGDTTWCARWKGVNPGGKLSAAMTYTNNTSKYVSGTTKALSEDKTK